MFLQVYQPAISQDVEGNYYLFWKVKDVEQRVPEFEDEGVRERVLGKWKEVRARDLATKEAQRLAAAAREKVAPAMAAAQRKEEEAERLEKEAREAPEEAEPSAAEAREEATRRASELREEAEALVGATNRDEVLWETADLFYFVLLNLVGEGLTLDEVQKELRGRAGRRRS